MLFSKKNYICDHSKIIQGNKKNTIAIIETFAKVRELSRTISQLSEQSDMDQQKSMMQKSKELISNILSDDFQTVETETTIEFNLLVLKVKHTVKKKTRE